MKLHWQSIQRMAAIAEQTLSLFSDMTKRDIMGRRVADFSWLCSFSGMEFWSKPELAMALRGERWRSKIG